MSNVHVPGLANLTQTLQYRLGPQLERVAKEMKRYNDARDKAEQASAPYCPQIVTNDDVHPYLIDINGEPHEVMHCRHCGVTFTMEADVVDISSSAKCACPNCGKYVYFHAEEGRTLCHTCQKFCWYRVNGSESCLAGRCVFPTNGCDDYTMVNAMTVNQDECKEQNNAS
jgi:hypothetical protein